MFYALSMLLYKILFILPHELSPVMLDNEYERKGVSTLSISHMQRNLSHICTIDLTPKPDESLFRTDNRVKAVDWLI